MAKYIVSFKNSMRVHEQVEADNVHCYSNGALVFVKDGEEANTEYLVKAYSAGIWDEVERVSL